MKFCVESLHVSQGPDKPVQSASGELPNSISNTDEKWATRQAAAEDRPVTNTDKWAGGALDALDARNQTYFPPPKSADVAPQAARPRWNEGPGQGARPRDLSRCALTLVLDRRKRGSKNHSVFYSFQSVACDG